MNDIFNHLKSIFDAHASELDVVHDELSYFYLNTQKEDDKGKPIFFGMIKATAKKVSFHLMPVYCEPSLLSDISPELKKRMQGKSCFNFSKLDRELFMELEVLTQASFDSYKANNKI